MLRCECVVHVVFSPNYIESLSATADVADGFNRYFLNFSIGNRCSSPCHDLLNKTIIMVCVGKSVFNVPYDRGKPIDVWSL